MNQDPLIERLRELNLRRPLTESEQAELRAWLAAHPEAQSDWEIEAALTKALTLQPDAPVPSNFTARVLQEIEREASASRRKPASAWVWRVFVPRAGLAMGAIAVAGVLIHQHNEAEQRIEFVKSPEVMTAVRSMPSVEELEDFDTISSLGPVAAADEELLALNSELQF